MRLLIVSNRLSFTIKEIEGTILYRESSGGLVKGLSAYLDSLRGSPFTKIEYIWLGWPGSTINDKYYAEIKKKSLSEHKAYPVFLSENDMENFYQGFCNGTIWPLFHCFPSLAEYKEEYWNSYKKVNETFCNSILQIIRDDDIIWIHDYHLMLLPKMIREKIPGISIGFFLHIPFPPYEIFRLLPKNWRREILEGLLGADLIGFHTNDYTQDYLRCVLRILGYDHYIGHINVGDRIVKADTFPMGIHFQKYYEAARQAELNPETLKTKKTLGNTKIIISVDRLDYTKGIINRLNGFSLFLEKNPAWHKKVSLLLIVVPSRIGVKCYQEMKKSIDELIGKINGRFSAIGWTPIQYQYKNLPLDQLAIIYSIGDVALITPLRDGMNLVAKEYLAARIDKTGVLILSEMTGAAKELGEAIIINPNHEEDLADALKDALEMSTEEQIRRNEIMQTRLKTYDVNHWADDFIQTLILEREQKKKLEARMISDLEMEELLNAYKTAEKRLIFLDYDGTLVPFASKPGYAKPDEEILNLLKTFSEKANTKLVIVSGREKGTLQDWFGHLNVDMIGEHGAWIRERGDDWKMLKHLSADWKKKIFPMLKLHTDRLPGSFIEEKDYSIAWHYRNAELEAARLKAHELTDELILLTANIDLQIIQGNKVVEVRNSGINKGNAGSYFISKDKYDFIMAIGDDVTDEDLFKALPESAWTLKVGLTSSAAKFNLKTYKEVRKLILDLIK